MNRRIKKHLKTQRDKSKSGRNAIQTRLPDEWKTEEVQEWLNRKVKRLQKENEQ